MPSQNTTHITLGIAPRAELDKLADGESKGFSFDQGAIFVVRHRSRFYAYRNRCPHLGIDLEWLPDQFLDHARQFIHCSTHGALFLIESGECIAGPCQGRHLQPVELSFQDQEAVFSMELPAASRPN